LVKLSLKLLGLALLYFLSFVICLAVEGVILVHLWAWFLVPMGIISIDFKQALGLLILVNFLTYHFYGFKREEYGLALLADALIFLLVRPLMILLIGAGIYYWF